MNNTTDFDSKREAYTEARAHLQRLIDAPDKSVPVAEYRTQLKLAHIATGAAHDAMLKSAAVDAAANALEEAADRIEPFSGIGMANGATRADVAQWLRARGASVRSQP